MRGTWLVVGALLVLATGCGEASSDGRAAQVEPVARPTSVPAAEGVVTTTRGVVVSDDGSGPQLCFGGISFGDPPSCSSAAVTGWDWSAVDDVAEQGGQRWGTYALTGTFDGSTFAVTEVSAPPGPEPYEFEIPCPTPEGGWQVLDPTRTSQDDLVHNRMEVQVFHDDGSIQRWADQEYGEGVVVVESILQPAG
jgi:hypothetical protein